MRSTPGCATGFCRLWRQDRVQANDIFDACDLRGKLFIDRQPLRQALRDMVAPDGTTRVLAVKGPSRSGKSHSIYLIEHAQRELSSYDKVEVSLSKSDSPVTFTPTHLARSVIDQIGGDSTRLPPEPKGVTEPRWLEQIADYLLGQLKLKGTMACLVLDGFAEANLNKLTKEMVQTLVKRADREPKLRLVLLDYNEDLLCREIAGRLVIEPIGRFSDDDLRLFITKYARSQRLPEPPAEAITAVIDAVVAKLPCREPVGGSDFTCEGGKHMKFMLMMNAPKGDGDWSVSKWSPEDLKAHIAFMKTFTGGLAASGELVGAEGLATPAQAKLVRASKDRRPITDGVFPESKEFLAGYWIVDVDSPERAYQIAAEASAAPGKGGEPLYMPIEVREVMSAPPVEV